MSRKQELFAAFDDAWDADWESLGGIVKQIQDEEIWYQHPIYAGEKREAGLPPPGTIMWHLVHLASCYRWYKASIEQRPNTPEEFEHVQPQNLDDAIKDLVRTRNEFRSSIEALSEAELDEALYYRQPVVTLARITVRHDAWHAAQIAVVRRMFGMRGDE